MRIIKKILKYGAIALLILIGVPLIIGQVLRLTASSVPPAGKMFDVGGHKLHINCAGPKAGSGEDLPTVVFEAGAGVASPTNYWILEGVSKTTRVCLYDRAGIGWSEENGLPKDAATVSATLRQLLDKAEVKRPFVFAGHSIAGLYMRDYTERYPDEVLGLAFLDPSHPKQNELFGLTAKQKAEQRSTVGTQLMIIKLLIRLGVFEVYNPSIAGNVLEYPEAIQNQINFLTKSTAYLDTVIGEVDGFDKAGEQAALNKTLGDRPVVVISATKPMQSGILPEGVSAEEFQSKFVKMHDEITALSSRGRHIKIPAADHMGLITSKANAAQAVKYILEVVRESAEKKPEAGPPAP